MFTCKSILTFIFLDKTRNLFISNYLFVILYYVTFIYEIFSSYEEKGFMLEAKSFVPKKEC